MMTPNRFRKPSIKDVARRAGVSTTTVSYFVNGREDVCAPETAARIRAAISDLQYTPNSLMRGLRGGGTQTIGACLYSPLDPEILYGSVFFERLWRGIVFEADVVDYSLLHYPFSVREGSNPDGFLDGRVDGLVFHSHNPARIAQVARAGMPTVMLMRVSDLPDGCGMVYADETQTVGLVMDHLYSLGHRRIAHLAGPARKDPSPDTGLLGADASARGRLEAYTDRMQAEGLYDPDLVRYADSWRDLDGRAADALKFWRSLPDPPTAVFCANDALALATVGAARALGWSVPESLSIVGVDDSAEARGGSVPLTTVAVPVEEIGREAVRALLRLVSGEPVASARVAVPVTQIVVRGSTSPCRPQA